jgi:RNA recognition motif-containing protein
MMTMTDNAHKLFVAGLPESVSEEVLRSLFTEAGVRVTELALPRDRATGRPRGFAFVRLASQEEADQARQLLDGRLLNGTSISVRPFQENPPARGERPERGGDRPGGDRPGGGYDRGPRGPGGGGGGGGYNTADRTLYVGNLPYDASQEDIETLFRNVGAEAPVKVHLPLDQDGRKRGFGFVSLGSADAAKDALEKLRGGSLKGRTLTINIALPKGTARPDGGPSDRGPGPAEGGGFRTAPTGSVDPSARFGPPSPPGGRRADPSKKRRDGEGEGPKGSRNRRENEDRWRDNDDDE